MDHFARFQGSSEQRFHDLTVFVLAQQFGIGLALAFSTQFTTSSDP
jgi:hypothetical protein